MKEVYDRKKGDSREYSIGDKVWLKNHITTTRPSKKLGDKRYGPFVVEKKKDTLPYRLTLPRLGRKSTRIQQICSLPLTENPNPFQQQPTNTPTIINDVEEFESRKSLIPECLEENSNISQMERLSKPR